ncbi:MAG TPA: MFS transporter [Anaerolineaceae bacterium]|jgi:predicted MFS family arabinose efflux permease|nr:MFS transporter [Anaerolineaceae bacterium]
MLTHKTLLQRIAFFTGLRLTLNTSIRMIYPYLAVFAVALQRDIGAISLVLAASMFTSAVGPFIAPIADRRGRKVGMLIGMGIFLAGTFSASLFPSYFTFFLAILVGNLGNNIFLPSMQAYLGDLVPYNKRGLYLAITELSWALSFILLVPLAGLIITNTYWYGPFIALSVLGSVMTILLWVLIPADHPANPEPLAIFSDIKKVILYPPALLSILMGTLFVAGNELVNVVFGVWIKDSFGLQIAALGAASIVIGLSELGGEGVSALLTDRLGKERTIALSLILNSLWVITLPWLGKTTSGAMVWLFFFYLTFEVAIVSTLPLMTEVTPATRATLLSLFVAAISLGRSLADVLAPLLFRGGFLVNVLVCVGFNLLSILALSRIRLPRNAT